MIDLEKVAAAVKSPPVQRNSQLSQDIFALAVTDWRRDGYFVEFGAMDGIKGSNTWLLERDYAWKGIVVEPGRVFHDDLRANRSCIIDTRAVAAASGLELKFKETTVELGLSGLVDYFKSGERHTRTRQNSGGNEYIVDTVGLTDLLAQHQAPPYIDYISIDTEGSERSILESFDFQRYRVGVWTIEHNNFEVDRTAIYDIMTQNGYQRVLTDLSAIDDWYIPAQ